MLTTEALPYPEEESITVAFTTSTHHPGSVAVPSETWLQGEPQRQSYVLPWTVATIKDDIHIVGTQGSVTDAFADRVATLTQSYFERPHLP